MLKFLRVLVTPFFWILYPMKIFHRERYQKKTKAVLVMNHLSAIDPILILKGMSIDVHFLGKKELMNSRFKMWFYRHAHVIGVDRDNVSMETIKECLAVLKSDRTLGVYPEGTRNRENRELQPLKEGVALFALMGRAPIVPVAIYRKIRIFRRSYLLVGEPFELTEFYGKKPDKEVLAAATERIREEMQRALDDLDKIMEARGK